MKFRKRITIFPGFVINLSKSGMSATIGVKGFSLNIGKDGVYGNTGIPGTGFDDRVKLNTIKKSPDVKKDDYIQSDTDRYDIIEIKSLDPRYLTSGEMFGLKKMILDYRQEKDRLKQDLESTKRKYTFFSFFMCISFIFLVGLPFFKIIIRKWKNLCYDKNQLNEEYSNYALDVDISLDTDIENNYLDLKKSFNDVANVNKIWSLVTSQNIDRVKQRSFASTKVNRIGTSFVVQELDFIKTQYSPITLKSSNGLALYFYPCFLIVINETGNDFAVISYQNINVIQNVVSFSETELLPSDAVLSGYTYKYVNKNGSPDRRYNDNPQIPIALYYQLSLSSSTGLNESYLISNAKIGEQFGKLLAEYVENIKNLHWSNTYERANDAIEDRKENLNKNTEYEQITKEIGNASKGIENVQEEGLN